MKTMIAVLALVVGVAASDPSDPFTYTWDEIAPGVWTGIREDSPRTPVMGTTTFVVGSTGVVVFDGGGVPVMSERAIDKIRAVTDKPVTHVIISHWHQDHNWGIKAFVDAYPNVEIVAHPYTRESLLARNAPALGQLRSSTVAERSLAAVEEQLKQNSPDSQWLRRFIDDMDVIEREYKRIEPVYPTLTFEQRVVIHSGDRAIELLYLGRGNTAGDIVMWLPAEKIVVTGDLVVRPTPYGFGSYPREWAATLREVNALGYEILVPGHGDIQRDTRYVDLLIETLDLVADQMAVLIAEGPTEEEAVERLDLSAVEERFTGGDAFLATRFRAWFKEPIALAAFQIAQGKSPELPQ